MNVWGVTFGGNLAKILSFKSGNLLYDSNFYLLSEGTVPSNIGLLAISLVDVGTQPRYCGGPYDMEVMSNVHTFT